MLQDLESNIKKLISAYETQKIRADKLEAELLKCGKTVETAENKIKQLEDKVDSLSLRSVFASSIGENSEAKARIDSLINEIDKALALLQ